METVFPLLFAALAVVSFTLRLLSREGARRASLDDWREAARKVGLTGIEDSRETLGGWSGPLHVRLSRYVDASARGTRIVVSGPGLPADLTVRPDRLDAAHRSRGAGEIEIG
ncbi:MAG TPA: hypothetical protein VMT70_14175, partial [Vicinamibacteria bacterium]|nr:hypothetical protein [Vicinamibacteria bacterium]